MARADQKAASQVEALCALVESMSMDMSIREIVGVLAGGVLSGNGRAFSQELISSAAETALEHGLSQEGLPAGCGVFEGVVVKALRELVQGSSLVFAHVVGQILWRNRRTKVLQNPRYRSIVEDFAWLEAGDNELEPTLGVLGQVDEVFRTYTAGEADGRMRFNKWQRSTRLLEANPVLSGRLKQTDVDRLFYTQTHQCSATTKSKSVSRREFKSLLLQLSETMEVHPLMVLFAVASQARYNDAAPCTDSPSTV